MTTENIHTYLNLFHRIGDLEFQLLSDRFKERSFRKGDIITSPGDVQKELYFITEGVQMSFFDTGDKSHVIAFTYPPNLCAIPESFSFQQPSAYTLMCLSDSKMYYITYNDLQETFNRSQEVERLFRKLAETILAGMINRHLELHSLSIEERFTQFCNRSPHLLQIVPHKYLASYLSIDPTNFSKLFNRVQF